MTSNEQKTPLATRGGITKKKTPASKTPKEIKNFRTHYTAKINQLKKAISKAKNNEDDASERVLKHRGALEKSNAKVCKDFLKLGLSAFLLENATELKELEYEDDEGVTTLAHDVAELLRALADLVDSKNAEATALEAELEVKNKEFAKWQMAQTLENTGLTKEQLQAMLDSSL